MLQVFACLLVSAFSCNSKSEEDEGEIVVTPAIVAVKEFKINRNDKVLAKLDSVLFAIDLNTGVIFNSDSLPKGTDVSKLVPSITFANTMTKAEISYMNEDSEKVTIDYLTHPEDSIDFRHPVTLDVTAQNGVATFSYQIKVNVHNQEPDTITWDRMAISGLPSRFDNPVNQKTVYHQDVAYCLIEEYNGNYTLSKCDELNEGHWEKGNIKFAFEPELESFTASPDNFWILDNKGELFYSADAENWISTNVIWIKIIGGYENALFGVRDNGVGLVHTQYPMTSDFEETALEEGFPVADCTELKVIESEWAQRPFAILAGGITEDNMVSSAVWAYDGSRWGIINKSSLPALRNPGMVRYVVYRDTPVPFTQRRFDVWLLMGGTDEEGILNRGVYISYDNGVNWQTASTGLQLPASFPSLESMDLIVAGYDLTSDLSSAWTPSDLRQETRAGYTIDGFDITWKCPYLYVFGGYEANGDLNTNIWRGVLARLTFVPTI